jgi:hypothetical protein
MYAVTCLFSVLQGHVAELCGSQRLKYPISQVAMMNSPPCDGDNAAVEGVTTFTNPAYVGDITFTSFSAGGTSTGGRLQGSRESNVTTGVHLVPVEVFNFIGP